MSLSFGPCISQQTYLQRVASLHENLGPKITRQQSQQLRRQEFESLVDYRLGVQFPPEKRERLFQALEKTYRFGIFSFFILYLAHLLKLSPQNHLVEGQVQRKFKGVSRAVAQVLSPEELHAFLSDDA